MWGWFHPGGRCMLEMPTCLQSCWLRCITEESAEPHTALLPAESCPHGSMAGGAGAELSLGALLQGGNQIACKTCQCVQRAPLGGIGLVHSPPAWSVMRLASCGTLPVLGANRKHLPPGQIPGT
ncbi:unnamed protein product [Eretmochelys imbricata]